MKKIIVLYPYYWPHFRAGGPVQSIFNLAGHLKESAEFYFVSLACDIDGSAASHSLELNTWQKGPQGENVYYSNSFSFFLFAKLFNKVKPDLVFVNGLFNASTTIPGILLAKWRKSELVISPRGMLQPWALNQRKWIKRLFITALKLILNKDEVWHATDELERKDILKNFGGNQVIHVASNIPRQVTALASNGKIWTGKIRLVYLSLINPNKNLHLIIHEVNRSPENFTLDIYGPISNPQYWEQCRQQIGNNPGIVYKGEVPAWEVQHVLSRYHFFVLPTQGENFGHAIFDALSSGVPVIISKKTPWSKIEQDGAGFYIDIDHPDSIHLTFNHLLEMTQTKYKMLCEQSLNYAKTYLASRDFTKEYQFLLL